MKMSQSMKLPHRRSYKRNGRPCTLTKLRRQSLRYVEPATARLVDKNQELHDLLSARTYSIREKRSINSLHSSANSSTTQNNGDPSIVQRNAVAPDKQRSTQDLDILRVYASLVSKYLILPSEQDFLLGELLPECEPARDDHEDYSDSDSTLFDIQQPQDCLEKWLEQGFDRQDNCVSAHALPEDESSFQLSRSNVTALGHDDKRSIQICRIAQLSASVVFCSHTQCRVSRDDSGSTRRRRISSSSMPAVLSRRHSATMASDRRLPSFSAHP